MFCIIFINNNISSFNILQEKLVAILLLLFQFQSTKTNKTTHTHRTTNCFIKNNFCFVLL